MLQLLFVFLVCHLKREAHIRANLPYASIDASTVNRRSHGAFLLTWLHATISGLGMHVAHTHNSLWPFEENFPVPFVAYAALVWE